jgi:hypothetical protein
MDLNCDGIVNLIGHQYAGMDDFDSYKYPDRDISIVTLANELDTALESVQLMDK